MGKIERLYVSGSAENSRALQGSARNKIPNIPQCTLPPRPVYQTLLSDFSRVWLWDYVATCRDQTTSMNTQPKLWRPWLLQKLKMKERVAGLFDKILALLTTYNTVAAGLTSLIGSIAESARYLSARDNHVIGVMSRCESNESRTCMSTWGQNLNWTNG